MSGTMAMIKKLLSFQSSEKEIVEQRGCTSESPEILNIEICICAFMFYFHRVKSHLLSSIFCDEEGI